MQLKHEVQMFKQNSYDHYINAHALDL